MLGILWGVGLKSKRECFLKSLLGENFRYRDSEWFLNLNYFIPRNLTKHGLRLELKFIHRCMEKLTANIVGGVIMHNL